jgi:hypothetical protein
MHPIVAGLVDLWPRAVAVQPVPSPAVVFGTAVAALVAVCYHGLWRLLRTVITTAHEAGHAFVAVCVGRRLSRIELHSGASGVTISRGRSGGPGMVATLLAGYLAPSAAGLGAALLVAAGHITGMLVGAVLALLLVLLRMRGGYGVMVVLLTAAVVLAVACRAPVQAQAVFAYAFTWFLLIGGLRPVRDLQRLRRHGRTRDSDADQLARLTGCAGGLWVALFFVTTAGMLVAGLGVLAPQALASLHALGASPP